MQNHLYKVTWAPPQLSPLHLKWGVLQRTARKGIHFLTTFVVQALFWGVRRTAIIAFRVVTSFLAQELCWGV